MRHKHWELTKLTNLRRLIEGICPERRMSKDERLDRYRQILACTDRLLEEARPDRPEPH